MWYQYKKQHLRKLINKCTVHRTFMLTCHKHETLSANAQLIKLNDSISLREVYDCKQDMHSVKRWTS